VLFLYGPMLVILVLSFQGPEGGLTFPLRGLSLHWFTKLAEGLGVVDIGAALKRSLALGGAVMALTVLFSVLAGLAFRKKLWGGNALFYVVVASLIMPSIIVSLGIGLEFRLIDTGLKWVLEALGMTSTLEEYGTVRWACLPRPWVPTSPGRCRLACSSCLRCLTVSIRLMRRRHAIWAPRPGKDSGTWCCR
jgi:putative spermidine/putrescine transport system permease protein